MMKLTIKQEGATVPPPSIVANAGVKIWRDAKGAVCAYCERRGDECWMHVPGVASYCFTNNGNDVGASIVDGSRTDAVLDAYRRRVLPMALQIRGCEVLHASAIRTAIGVVGFCGVSGTGKSTTAFGLAQRGYDIWCDDALAFEVAMNESRALSLPFELRLRPTSWDLFPPDLALPLTRMSEAEPPGSKTATLGAICILHRTAVNNAPIAVERLTFADSFVALLDNACWFHFQSSDDKRRLICNYMNLAAQIPVFRITFRSGADSFSATLDAIEKQIVGVTHV